MQFGSGTGEHAECLLRVCRPRSLTLVDSDQTNLDASAKRLEGRRNIIFARAAGAEMIADGSQTAAFSYDYLVRLEHDDVAEFLQPDQVGEGAADIAGADQRDLPAGHGNTPGCGGRM